MPAFRCFPNLLCAVLLFAPAGALASAAPASEDAQPHSALLVELFTSEGCSSCPPADQLLRQVNGTRTPPGQLIVGVSEHVTYWNNLGWTDPYSAAAYTDRQNAYGKRFRLDSVYTPQMVINGREQIVGSNEAALASALRDEAQRTTFPLRILSAQRSGDALSVHYSFGAEPGGKPLDIVAVIADDRDRSHVQRGENAGRSLDHVNVARLMMRVATVRGSGEQTFLVPMPQSVLGDPNAGHHLILFAQMPGYGAIVGAAESPL